MYVSSHRIPWRPLHRVPDPWDFCWGVLAPAERQILEVVTGTPGSGREDPPAVAPAQEFPGNEDSRSAGLGQLLAGWRWVTIRRRR
jgi:hypothetical protein